MTVEPGLLYGVDDVEIDNLRHDFLDCEGSQEGGIAFGEVRVFELEDPETGQNPTVTTATVKVVSADTGAELTGCYLREDGAGHDATAGETGTQGFFAVFGVPEGRHTLVVRYRAFDDDEVETYFDIWMPGGDYASVPRFPAFVEFPF
jgi:hypothetical protein